MPLFPHSLRPLAGLLVAATAGTGLQAADGGPPVLIPQVSPDVVQTLPPAVADQAPAQGRPLNLVPAGELVGQEVVGPDGVRVGKVLDLMADLSTGRVAYLVVLSREGGRSRLLAVPPGAVSGGDRPGRLVLATDPERLARAPDLDPHHWTRQSDPVWMDRVYSYYGLTPHWLVHPPGQEGPQGGGGAMASPGAGTR